MKRLMAALLATTCLTAPTPARAEPISIAILTAVSAELAASATAVAITTFALTTAATIGISMAASALLSKPEQASDTPAGGADLSVQYGSAIARSAIMGPGAVGGHHVYTNVYGPYNETMDCVFVIGDGKHGKLTRLKYNGKDCTLPVGGLTHGVTYAVPEFIVVVGPTGGTVSTPAVGITYYDGRYDQEADPGLIAHSNPPGRWTADHRGRGQAYIAVHQIYAEGDYGLTGIPQVMIETEGLVLYDPRKDSTNGGSGAHRWGNPATYEPSANPAVQEYNFRRGVLVNGQRVLGMSMSPVNLILQMYFAAANINDEAIPLAEGGTEPRYRCSIAVSDDRAASDVLSAMRAATAGWSFERGGQFGPIPGVPQIPISSLAFTDDDMIVGASARFTKYRSRSELVTATFGQFADPAQFWVPTSFPPRESPTDDAAIGERIAKSLDLTQVYSSSQAQRVAESERRKSLQQGQGTATLPAKWIGVQPGDWLPYNSQRHGNMNVLVTGTTLDTAKQQVTVTYERTSNTVYSWTTAGELFPPDIGDPGQTGTLIMIAAGMTATGVNLPGDGGLFTPGIQFAWTPIFDPTVDQIDFEIRKVGDTKVLPFTADFPAAGSAVCSGHGIAAATVYEYRHKLFTVPERPTPWSAYVSVTSGSQHVVPTALTSAPIGEITLAMFEAGLKDYVANELAGEFYWQDRFEQLIASVAVEQEAANWLDLQTGKEANTEIVRQISAVTGGYTYRGDYSATALYHPNDMVRMASGKLYTTNSNVQGVAPPAAPWAEQMNAAFISQEWRNFSGPDYSAAQTSDQIQANFYGTTLPGQANLTKSVASVHSEWTVFAGPTYAGASTLTNIESRFGVDGPAGTLPRSLALLIQDWKTFAGIDYAAAQTSDQIKAMFGHDASGTLPRSLSLIIQDWQAFAGQDYAAASTSNKIEARFVGGTVGAGADAATNDLASSLASVATNWVAFAGGDHAAASTHAQIEARFGVSGPAGTLPRSLALIISDWVAFAGTDYSTSQTSSKLEARFTGTTQPDGTANDMPMSVSSVTTKWKTFAGGDNAAAQTSAQIEARFTGVGEAGVGIPISLATLISKWDVFADASHSVSSSSDQLVAAINGTSASIEGTQTASANINGKLSATWQVKLDVNNYVSGLQLYNDGTLADFTIVTDVFRVAKPGVGGGAAVPVFEVGTYTPVGGAPQAKVVLRGDIIADGSITSKSVTTGTLITFSGQIADALITSAKIGNLQVQSIHIENTSVTHADAAVVGSNAATGTFQTIATVTLPCTNSINGSKIPVTLAGQYGTHRPTGAALAIEVQVLLNGTLIYYNFFTGAGDTTNIILAGGSYILGNGGTATATLQMQVRGQSGDFVIGGSVMTGAAFKR